MFYQIFFLPQVKRRAIISNKLAMYELLHGLPNDLRSSEIRKGQKNLKTSSNDNLVPAVLPPK